MSLPEAYILQALDHHYRLQGKLRHLAGYEETNYLLETANSEKRIIKLMLGEKDADAVVAQALMLKHLSHSPLKNHFQEVIQNREGNLITRLQWNGHLWLLRVFTFVSGTFWHEAPQKTPEMGFNLGTFLGRMDCTLKEFRHAALHRRLDWDIAQAGLAVRDITSIEDFHRRRIADYFLLQFETHVAPALPRLRHAYIHNDVNDYNILMDGSQIAGVIDFGDAVFSALIHNVAIACTYAAFDQTDALRMVCAIVAGYHGQYPLDTGETDLLYYLIAARLCISVTQSARKKADDTGNAHHFLSDHPAWELLEKWIQINPRRAANRFREACGFEPHISPNQAILQSKRHHFVGHNLSLSYHNPLKIDAGALQYVYDDQGNTYVDCVNNVSHVGHCHPVVVRAMQKQIATLNTNTRYLHGAIVDYAEALTATLPPKLSVCYFVNSGSEANDLAIRMARHFTRREDVLVLDHAYHGTSTLAMEMSPYKFDQKAGSGQKPYIHKLASPDLYRGKYRYDDPGAGEKYANEAATILQALADKHAPVAAFICETLLGVGGQIPLPPAYLEQVYRHVRNHGGLCIADEVQVGFGRVGEAFWGFELQGVEPDIVVLGKPMGNGHPLAAVVVSEPVADAFNNGLEYFNTFGGNPVSMVTGMAVLQVIKGENLQAHALETGNYLLSLLRTLAGEYPIIGDVRGHGLFIGVELVKSRETRQPAVEEIRIVVEKMKERGFLLSTDGPLNNVLKIKPPLVFSGENAGDLVQALAKVLEEL